MKSEAIQLGNEVKDKISGFRGIAISRCEYLYGCVRVGVQPKAIKKDASSPNDAIYFDEPQLELVGKGIVENVGVPARPRTYGPRADPQRRTDPR